jgi:serine/threonine protein kinase
MVKKSFRNAADRENSKRMFEREVSLLRALAHPNILSLIDTMETEDDYILITEYLAGGQMFGRFASMEEHYSEKVHFQFDLFSNIYVQRVFFVCLFLQTVSHLAKQMLQALFYCHKHHIVHCDLKPASTTHL